MLVSASAPKFPYQLGPNWGTIFFCLFVFLNLKDMYRCNNQMRMSLILANPPSGVISQNVRSCFCLLLSENKDALFQGWNCHYYHCKLSMKCDKRILERLATVMRRRGFTNIPCLGGHNGPPVFKVNMNSVSLQSLTGPEQNAWCTVCEPNRISQCIIGSN